MFRVEKTPAEKRSEAGLIVPGSSMTSYEEVYAPVNRDLTTCVKIKYTDLNIYPEVFNKDLVVWEGPSTAFLVMDALIVVTEAFTDGVRMESCTVSLGSESSLSKDDILSTSSCMSTGSIRGFDESFTTNSGLASNGSIWTDLKMRFTATGQRLDGLTQGELLLYLTWRQYGE